MPEYRSQMKQLGHFDSHAEVMPICAMQTVGKQAHAFTLVVASVSALAWPGCGSKGTPKVVSGIPEAQSPSEARKSYSLADLSPIVGSSSYTLVTQEVGGPGVLHRFVKSTTTLLNEPGPSDCPGVQWVSMRIRTWEDASTTERYEIKGCQGEKGDGFYAISANGGPEERFATKIQLPSTMKVGDSWEAIQEGSGSPSFRSCEVKPPTVCEEGVNLECVTKFDNRTVWIRNFYCLAEGWMGQINVLALDEKGEVTRSVDIVFNGKSKRDVSQLETPFPTLEEARTLGQRVKDRLINTP